MLQNDASNNDLSILSDTFKYHKTSNKVKVSLHTDCIRLYDLKDKQQQQQQHEPNAIYYMRDIVGSSMGKSPKQKDNKAYLSVYMYPRASKKDLKRKRFVLELEYSTHDTYERNLECVNDWSAKLSKILNRSPTDKPFLVYVNPNSGSGKAVQLFQERIKPIWAEACVPFAMILTKHANYAYDHVQKLDLNGIKGIICVSGDGLVYEIINGLMNRPDWQEAIKTPIGQLPGGSGNALAASISYLAKEPFNGLSTDSFAMHMGFLSSKHDILPMDLIAMDHSPPKDQRGTVVSKRVYSFLSTEWAIVADVDLESEKYRFLGGFRFVVGALKRIINLVTYRGRMCFKPSTDWTPKGTWNIIKRPQIVATEASSAQTSDPSVISLKHLPPLDQPLPDDFLIIEDSFVLVLVIHKPLIGQDFLGWPDSKLDNNDMGLIMIKEGITKMQLLKLFGETETGEYLKNDLVEFVRVKAFRIEPLEDRGTLMIDGEHVPYGPIQGEILPPMLNVIAKRIESY